MVLQTDPQISQSDYQKSLDQGIPNPQNLNTGTVRYWSDFNRVFYHPRSIVQINDYELGSTLMPFEKWENGEELFMSMDRDADLLDCDVRVWAEECDQMQGIQVFTGGDDAWGGFASKYVERLRDEYGKMPTWAWGIEEEQGKGQRAKQLLRTVNAARTIHEMSMHTSLYVPVSLPAGLLPEYVHLNRDSHWHVSALLSTAVESMTLPSRLRPDTQKRGFLGDIDAALNANGNQRIAQLQCSILDPDLEPHKIVSGHGSNDDRAPSNTNRIMIEEVGLDASASYLDTNLSAGDTRSSSSFASQGGTSDHTFGSVECIRGRLGATKKEEADEDEVIYARKRRRFAGLLITERSVPCIKMSLLERAAEQVESCNQPLSVAWHPGSSTNAT